MNALALTRALVTVVCVCLAASACGADNDDAGQKDSKARPAETAIDSSKPATTAEDSTGRQNGSTPTGDNADGQPQDRPETGGPPEGLSLTLTPVASLPDPLDLTTRPNTGGDLYVATRAGQVWLLGADGDEPPEMVLDITDKTNDDCENGLLSIAFSPDGTKLYVSYTDQSNDSKISEYPMDGQWVQVDRERVVLSVDQPACNHNGGHIDFGPDGLLWVALGDGGGSNDQFGNGQNLDSLLGSIIRIQPESSSGADYDIPGDNPFVGRGARAETWAYGARNPWRFSFDRATDDLWIGDVGQNAWEEVHVLRAADGWAPGANLGWPLFEGNERFSGTATPGDLDFPVYVYSHDYGCSITGGHVYRGSAIPSLVGAYVFGDFCISQIWGLATDGQGNVERINLGVSVPSATLASFGEDASGELYVLSFDDTVYRLDPAF